MFMVIQIIKYLFNYPKKPSHKLTNFEEVNTKIKKTKPELNIDFTKIL